MKKNYKIIINIIVSYLPWTIIDSWKSNISVNCFVQFVLQNSQSQFFTSYAFFNCCAYTQRVDRIISCKSSSFSIYDLAFWGTLPTPHALRPDICNNYFEANLTNVGFGNGGYCFAKVTSLSHFCCVLAWMWLTTFWSFCLCTTITFPKIWTLILAWSWCRGPLTKVEGLLCLTFSATSHAPPSNA